MSKYPEIVDEINKIAEDFLKEKRSNHHRDHFFPMMINKLGLEHGVEIGTDKGEFANHILERSKIKTLTCIDPWIDDFGSDHRPGFFDKNGSVRMQTAAETLAKHIGAGRCFLHRGFSRDAANDWTRTIDFLYIDGDHSLEGIFTDLYSWVPKVRTGGIIAGHDYKDGPKSGMKDFFGEQLPYKVKTVVDNFCQQYGYKVNEVGGRILSFWFVKN